MRFRNRLIPIVICFAVAVLILAAGLNYTYDPLDSFQARQQGRINESVSIPILMYHHFSDNGAPGSVISADMFECHMKALVEAGCSFVSFREVCDYVNYGTPLPEKPVLITIDDGYTSVYETAYPILLKYNIKATVFIVGAFYGKAQYKDTPYLLIPPHFGDDEAREMIESGLISIQSHSYDMHQYEPYELEYRRGILRKPGETREEYDEVFRADFEFASAQIENTTGLKPFVYSYPFGRHTNRSETLLKGMGVESTVTIIPGMNTIIKGVPESMYKLRRFIVYGDMTPEKLLKKIHNNG